MILRNSIPKSNLAKRCFSKQSIVYRSRPTKNFFGFRKYATETQKSSTNTMGYAAAAVVMIAGGAYYLNGMNADSSGGPSTSTDPKDYNKVYKSVVDLLDSEESSEYEDGSFGPILLRLAWHASGTYDKVTKTGGSNGATMRFPTEGGHGANNGLAIARKLLEPIKAQYPWISYSDLWILAGIASVQQLSAGACLVPFRPGRTDLDETASPPDGRLPDASQGATHVHNIFSRMGFDEQETVALIGAHALGRCHTDRSGFEGPWTYSPTTFSNQFYELLLSEKWNWRKWSGPKQYANKSSGTLMMLPTDMSLIEDKSFKTWVDIYAKDEQRFFSDFSKAVCKLFELGVPFKEGVNYMNFKYIE